jgi:PAS domain S-box-containing protein
MKKGQDDPAEPRRRAQELLRERQAGSSGLSRTEDDGRKLLHELQVHQIELEMQNEELRRAEAEVQASLDRYADLYDFAPVGYFTLAGDGAIRAVNLTGAALLGIERSRLEDRRFALFVADEFRPAFNAFLANVFEGRAKQQCEVALLKEGNSSFFARIDATLSGEGRECRAVVADITERKAREAEIVRLNHLYIVLSQIDQAIVRARSREEIFQSVCRIAVEFGHFQLAWIGSVDPASGVVATLAAHPDEQGFPHAIRAGECSVVQAAVAEGRPSICNDILGSPFAAGCHRLALGSGIGSCAAFPIRSLGRVCCALCLHASQPGFFNPTEAGLLDEVSLDIAFALEKLEEEARRRKAEEDLRASEERYRSLFENMREGLAYCKMLFENGEPRDFLYLAVNRAFELLTGLKDVAGRKVSEAIPGIQASNPELFEIYGRVASTGKPERFEVYVESLGIWFSISVYSPERERFVAMFEDITERKRHEVDREMTVALLRQINAPNDTHELIRTVTGYLQEWSDCEAVGIRLRDGADFPYFETRGLPGDFVQLENFLCAKDTQGELLLDSQGDPVLECMCGNVLCGRFDPRLPFFTENGSFWTNSTTELLASATEADRQSLTRNRCNTAGYESVALIPLRSAGRTLGLLQFNDRRKGRFTLANIVMLERAASSITIALEQRKAQAALRESERTYRTLFETVPQGVVYQDAGGVITSANPAAERILGLTAGQMRGATSVDPHWHAIREDGSPFPGECHPSMVALKTGKPVSDVVMGVFNPLKAQYSWIAINAVPLFSEGKDQPDQIYSTFEDITERKRAERERARLEEELQQAQKMESVGRLAGGVAHDFNNLLTVINGHSDLMLGRLSEGDPLRNSLAEIRKAGGRAAGLTQQLLAFSRKQIVEPKPVNLNQLVAETRDMLERLAGEDIELVTVPAPGLGAVMADQGQLCQVLMNLVANAKDAMPGGGRLTIETANLDLDRDCAAAHSEIAPGPYILLTVSDTGTGMDEETREHIFEPFFTTKDVGKGTGLGLSTVYGIVRQCEGWIWVYSEPGQGATFKIYLPRVEQTPAPAAAEAPAPAPGTLRGAETVLVVEDQEDVRRLTVEILKSYGYRVLEAALGGDALLLAEQHPGPIHLLLTDVAMPRMTGKELAGRLKPLRPQMRALYMSGYAENVIAQQGTLDPGVAYISKPFTPEALALKVREALGPPRSAGKILVVDDEEGIRNLFWQVLTGAGYEVSLASDGQQALKLVQDREFDVVVTDLVMPEREGIETIQALRKEHRELKIVAISGAFGGKMLRTAELLGANAALLKPVTPALLLATLGGLIE